MAFAFLKNKLVLNYSYCASFIRHTQPSRFYCKNEILVSLFQSYGFTEKQISSLVIKIPHILSRHPHPEKTLKPKLDFLTSVGLSPSDVHKIVTVGPRCLNFSLEDQIIPCYDHLKSILRTTENVNFSIKRAPCLLWQNWQKYIAQNMDALRECGVASERILFLLKTQPRTMILKTDKLTEIILKIKKMGFDPQKSHFLTATRILAGIVGPNWEKKKQIYKKWGWSDKDILAAFKKSPICMGASNNKIETAMDFLVDKMGFSPSEVAKFPNVISYSLEKWTIPRCLVHQFLLSKGLIERKRLAYLIPLNKQQFSRRFLNPYTTNFPELISIYEPTALVSLDLEDNSLEPNHIQIL